MSWKVSTSRADNAAGAVAVAGLVAALATLYVFGTYEVRIHLTDSEVFAWAVAGVAGAAAVLYTGVRRVRQSGCV